MARNKEKENDALPGTSVLAINGKPAKPRAIWNKLTVQVLITTLLAQKAEGNQTDNSSWKPEAFNACVKALVGTETGLGRSGGPPKTAKMCMTRWTAVSLFFDSFGSVANVRHRRRQTTWSSEPSEASQE
jgi:hypothetical protein